MDLELHEKDQSYRRQNLSWSFKTDSVTYKHSLPLLSNPWSPQLDLTAELACLSLTQGRQSIAFIADCGRDD